MDKAFDLICNLLIAIINFLPNSPFEALLKQVEDMEYLGFVNYFIPFDFCVIALNSWLVCVGVYYGVKYAKKVLNYLKNLF